MNILVIEPVKSSIFEDETVDYLEGLKDPETRVTVKSLGSGPTTIETYFDVVQASPGLISMIMEEDDHYDAFVINCFADPGLDAAREISDGLVLGVAETTMHAAAMIADRFSVITTDRNSIPWTIDQARAYALGDKLASVVAVDVGVDRLTSGGDTYSRMLNQAKKELDKGSEAIVLGCTGMKSFAEQLQEDLQVPVMEPTKVTFKIAESMAKIGIKHSKHLKYSMTDEKIKQLKK